MHKEVNATIMAYSEAEQQAQQVGQQQLVFPVLTSADNPLKVPSIRNHADDEIFAVILMALATSYTDLGWKQPAEKDRHYVANKLADSIPAKFPSIRLHEIPQAFATGIRGKYGPFMGLGVVTFENFIEAHLTSETREQFAKEVLMLPDTKEPDMDTKFNTAKYNALKAYYDKKSGQDISIVALVVYNFLDELKLIPYSAKDKWDFVDQAKAFLVKEFTYQLTTARFKQDKEQLKRKIAGVINGYSVNLIINTSKRIALCAFFEELELENANLYELIESRKELFYLQVN
ncbi:hypothetical protein ACXZ1K_16070 [Pedobacter sp. PWIIR3]